MGPLIESYLDNFLISPLVFLGRMENIESGEKQINVKSIQNYYKGISRGNLASQGLLPALRLCRAEVKDPGLRD